MSGRDTPLYCTLKIFLIAMQGQHPGFLFSSIGLKGQKYNIGEKTAFILYAYYVNRHSGDFSLNTKTEAKTHDGQTWLQLNYCLPPIFST